LTVGNLDVDILTVGNLDVDKRRQHRESFCELVSSKHGKRDKGTEAMAVARAESINKTQKAKIEWMKEVK
jgi:hypothetical protein